MNKTSKTLDYVIRPGMTITGKWHKKSYLIKRKLGNGAIGSVYLCEMNGKQAALKISDKSSSMTMEVNVLKSLEKAQGNRLGPYLLDVDDWVTTQGNIYSFYVMEYVRGIPMADFIKGHGSEWVGVFMLQLLEDLGDLHQSGWVFGDLKTENLLVASSPPKVRWIDVGGTTQIGRAIKEYTEFYDRGYWELGSRRAEPSYDLFAFVMVFLSVYYPKRFQKGSNPKATLLKKMNDVKALKPYNNCLKKAILGRYHSSAEMKQEITDVLYHAQKGQRKKQQDNTGDTFPFVIESLGICIIALGYYLSSIIIP
ncbi:protein kinase [Ornithinibacillus sp. L9]|uniref:Protein kinase n=2 Tax=Ornithinibacillus caprae TaxID=2678566 RepID=A0A6N8FJA6_9BACI|nr:protein kinase [Ornithinibacillus caprae]MUK88057.1 protein kinase [Ornithinibacillus caprae]